MAPPYSAHENGYAVHVWTNGDADETPESYAELLDLGIDGIMTTSPRKLNAYLCSAKVPHPNGKSRCATKAKKKPMERAKGDKAQKKCAEKAPIEVVVEPAPALKQKKRKAA